MAWVLTKTDRKASFANGRSVIRDRVVYETSDGREVVKFNNDYHFLERSSYSDIHRISFGISFYRQVAFNKTNTEFIIKK